jgi:hypothetical protein
MKITILCYMDFCGSGNKIYQALKPYHDVEVWAGEHHNPYGHPVDNIYTIHKNRQLQRRINNSKVVLLKGDFPQYIYEQLWKIKLTVPTIIMTTGSFARKKIHGGKEKFPMQHYRGLKTSSDTGLLYPEYSDRWTPLPINSEPEPILWQPGNTLTHSPTDQSKKNTEFVFRVFDGVMKQIDVNIDLIEGVSFAEAVKRRKKSTIFFDQFKVGFYGNSALEAMQWGIPVACYLRPSHHLSGCPVITMPLDVDLWVAETVRLLRSDMTELSKQTKEWCDRIHSYSAVAKMWDEILNTI